MNTEKQIEEMAERMAETAHLECGKKPCEECKWCGSTNHEKADCSDYLIAEGLYNAGYRKASEVAEEIFAEIEKEIEAALESNYRAKKEHYNHSVIPNYDNFNAMCDGKIYAMRGLLDFITELKKKYESEKDDG